ELGIEVAEAVHAGQRGHLVHDDLGLRGLDRGHHGLAVKPVDDDGRCPGRLELGRLGRRARGTGDLVARRDQAGDEVLADDSGRPRDEDSHDDVPSCARCSYAPYDAAPSPGVTPASGPLQRRCQVRVTRPTWRSLSGLAITLMAWTWPSSTSSAMTTIRPPSASQASRPGCPFTGAGVSTAPAARVRSTWTRITSATCARPERGAAKVISPLPPLSP